MVSQTAQLFLFSIDVRVEMIKGVDTYPFENLEGLAGNVKNYKIQLRFQLNKSLEW